MVDASHQRRGYDKSSEGWYVAYHYFIGRDGTVVQTRPVSSRTMHTRNNAINMRSIGIVLAGNFEEEQPTQRQAEALTKLIKGLSKRYDIARHSIMGHKEASPDKCPGENLKAILEKIKRTL